MKRLLLLLIGSFAWAASLSAMATAQEYSNGGACAGTQEGDAHPRGGLWRSSPRTRPGGRAPFLSPLEICVLPVLRAGIARGDFGALEAVVLLPAHAVLHAVLLRLLSTSPLQSETAALRLQWMGQRSHAGPGRPRTGAAASQLWRLHVRHPGRYHVLEHGRQWPRSLWRAPSSSLRTHRSRGHDPEYPRQGVGGCAGCQLSPGIETAPTVLPPAESADANKREMDHPENKEAPEKPAPPE